ncbi:MAG TPA: FtsQ-type POTRA domain-containing protein [Vicinamibacterales bacterium]|nr:FtsQ-type POTRA domain-containing protein [Vicinamibacterales bacterium]
MGVKAPAEKNFRRAKVRPGRRKGPHWGGMAWRAGRGVAVALLVGYAGFRATSLVLHASSLQVTRISVNGNVRLSSGEVQAIVDGLRGSNILTVDLPQYRARLMASPWIADVALRRVLPSTIQIFVSERRPMGVCRIGPNLYLVDPHGVLIDEFGPQYSEFDLPIIDGLVRGPSSGQPIVDEGRAELASRVIDALAARKDLASRVSQIDVHDARDAVVLLESDPAMLHLGDDRFVERLQNYVDLSSALHARVPEIDYVDLRFDERVYVRPVGGTARPISARAR